MGENRGPYLQKECRSIIQNRRGCDGGPGYNYLVSI